MTIIDKKRRGLEPDGGFTLVEMMVALIVIAILVAIAIPTFLSARERTSNRAAQAKAQTAVKAHKAQAAAGQDPADTPTLIDDLEDMEPAVTFKDFADYSPTEVKGVVYVRVEDDPSLGKVVKLVAESTISGKCFWTRDINGVTSYATTECPNEPTTETQWSLKGW